MSGAPRPVAGWSTRLAALTVDAVALTSLALLLLVGLLHAGAGGEEAIRDSRRLAAAIASSALLGSVPLLALMLMTAARLVLGRTPGQWLLGFEVIRAADGRPAGAARVLLRGAVLLLALLPAGLGLLWTLLDRERRAPHDRLAGTLPIEEDEATLTLALLETRL